MAITEVGGRTGYSGQVATLAPTSTALATLYSCTEQGGISNLWMHVGNFGTAAANVTANFVKGGGSAGNGDYWVGGYSLGAGSWIDFIMPDMNYGDVITVQAGAANALAFSIQGVRQP